jgi:ubiquinone/menaquinone biosynthesis C-methylase UbiE
VFHKNKIYKLFIISKDGAMNRNDHYEATKEFHRISAVEKDGYYEAVTGKPQKHLYWQLRIRKMVLNTLDKLIPGNPDIFSAIDIGCGRGDFTVEIAKRYPQLKKIYGCDFVKEALSIARRDSESLLNISFEEAELLNLPYDNNSFDLTLCINVLHHIYKEDSEKALTALARITKRYLVLEIKNINNFLYRDILPKSLCGMTVYPISITKVSNILKNDNFELIENHGIFLFKWLSPLIVLVYEKQD